MNKSIFVLALLSLFVFFTACATTPPPEDAQEGQQQVVQPPVTPGTTTTPTTPADPTIDQVSLDALNAAQARAAESRRRAEGFDAPAFFPSEWDSAMSLLNDAEQRRSTASNQDARDSAARYNSAADAFDALYENAAAEGFREALRDLAAARAAAVAAGAEIYAPAYLAEADNAAARAQREYDAGNYEAARDSAMDAYALYNAIRMALEAQRIRDEIARLGFEGYDSENIRSGDSAFSAAQNALTNSDYNEALDRAEEALSRFSAALNAAWQNRAWGRRDEAVEERQRAQDVRANIAAREEYDPAEAIFHLANTALMRENFEEAIDFYDDCIPMFIASHQIALQRRAAAQEALERADRRLLESEQTAMAADELLEGDVE
ncbi:MAG: hypothetical protein FWG77_06500 [Treponema sp.]|nr:hypothetical protein [Treponema sp.]